MIKRFEDKVFYSPDGCWYWTGAYNSKGYGCIDIDGKNWLAHRYSYAINNDKINIDGMNCCHSCDNPKCVNPDHIFLGTQKDNIIDCIKKGRHKRSSNNKISYEDAVIIRDMNQRGFSFSEIAELYNLTSNNIRFICIGKLWNAEKYSLKASSVTF